METAVHPQGICALQPISATMSAPAKSDWIGGPIGGQGLVENGRGQHQTRRYGETTGF